MNWLRIKQAVISMALGALQGCVIGFAIIAVCGVVWQWART